MAPLKNTIISAGNGGRQEKFSSYTAWTQVFQQHPCFIYGMQFFSCQEGDALRIYDFKLCLYQKVHRDIIPVEVL